MKQLLKTVISFGIRLCLRVFYLFPIRKNRVFFSAYSGALYGCNPKYISEYLALHHPDLELVWCWKNNAPPSVSGVSFVRFCSFSYFKQLLTARVVVFNDLQNSSYLPFRKEQFVVQTWHGCGLYKKVGHDTPGNTTWNDRRLRRTIDRISCFLSGAKAFSETVVRQAFGYTGDIREIGMPRNDVLLNAAKAAETSKKVRSALGVSEDTFLVLYAPTFRGEGQHTARLPSVSSLLTACQTRFGKAAKCLVRSHHLPNTRLCEQADTLDVTDYPDMQELLCAADLLLSDYSSSIWDFGLTGKPCFLYTPDLSDYRTDRDFYLDIQKWPFPLAETDDALCRAIETFDPDLYAKRLKDHYQLLQSVESGNAAMQIGEEIAAVCHL